MDDVSFYTDEFGFGEAAGGCVRFELKVVIDPASGAVPRIAGLVDPVADEGAHTAGLAREFLCRVLGWLRHHV